MAECIKKKILKSIEELSAIYPDWRFGQLVANVAYWAKEPTSNAIWDVEDEEFYKAIEVHLKKKDIP